MRVTSECPYCEEEFEYEAWGVEVDCPHCQKKCEAEFDYGGADYDTLMFWLTKVE